MKEAKRQAQRKARNRRIAKRKAARLENRKQRRKRELLAAVAKEQRAEQMRPLAALVRKLYEPRRFDG